MDLGLRDRVALVSASSQGLGRAVAQALAAEGARLSLFSRSRARIEEVRDQIRDAHGVEVLAQCADVNIPADLARVVQGTLATFGRIDICVTNGPGPAVKAFHEVEMEDWQRAFQSNFLSAAMLAKEVLPVMARQGWGRLVMISSIVARQPEPGFILSQAIRPGISGLVRTLADEYGPHNITVNAVLPGTFATGRLARVSDAGVDGPDYERWARTNCVRRIGRPAEFGAAVAFLCSQPASFITGSSLSVDGGFARGLF
jgi:3-oxoacyl-[acyl-carrier protein] reductase